MIRWWRERDTRANRLRRYGEWMMSDERAELQEWLARLRATRADEEQS